MASSVSQSSILNEGELEDNDKVPARPQLNLSGAAIFQEKSQGRDPAILLPNQRDDIPLLALDIGGTLIKMVYFSRHGDPLVDDKQKRSLKEGLEVSNGSNRSYPVKGGCLHFLKFDTRKINECLDFIDSKQLHRGGNYWRSFSEAASKNNAVIKATGGGAYMYANLFKERLGVNLDKEDEMDSLVAGANFLLKAIHHEAFTHMDGQKEFVQIDENDLFPYLLVNIGSGVSIIKVDGNGSFQRVDGTHAGGGTYCGQECF
ncbi:pantothenate kinase 2-like [Papaver somniferum]|uniref:pantothenate kinase 2-like n=1 Tax=Papaver somniferum TaxID=3469 RepID=UPI000E7044DF|nr:pantothenate kinase 2-like [Papaver somniferum]